MQSLHKLSLIVDIDGVIIQSKQAIPGAKEGIQMIQQHNIPFLFFTNNTSKSEETKAQELTSLLSLSTPISKQQVVLNYTPMKKLFTNWKDKLVLIIGREEIDSILPFEEMPHYITIKEYVHIFPQVAPFTTRYLDKSEQIRCQVGKRLGMERFDILEIKFDVVLILNSPTAWEESIQVILDILSTNDGRVTKDKEYKYHEGHIPIYSSLNDLWFRKKDHPLPRLLVKPFCLALKAVYKEIYGQQLKITHYGKPTHKAFEYVHRHMDELYGRADSYVMIGDNIDTDIIGAYNYGWKSVLVQTGVSLHGTDKCDHSCRNLLGAVEWAIQSHGITMDREQLI